MRLLLDHIDTPTGVLTLVADEEGNLRTLGWVDGDARMEARLTLGGSAVPARDPSGLSSAVRAWFAGDLAALDGIPVRAEGTEFQRRVWAALRAIPCGVTWSYRDLAVKIGNPAAVRAVGLANGRNPICIVVPCHRVIGADGSLTGYGGGLERKRWLLAHEQPKRACTTAVQKALDF
jgi:methylated-DNA-[protein]-cysteine S-methyltransferase